MNAALLSLKEQTKNKQRIDKEQTKIEIGSPSLFDIFFSSALWGTVIIKSLQIDWSVLIISTGSGLSFELRLP
jgi:hypothetical protein